MAVLGGSARLWLENGNSGLHPYGRSRPKSFFPKPSSQELGPEIVGMTGTSMSRRCLLKKIVSARTFAFLLSLLLLCQSCASWNRKHAFAGGYILDVAMVPPPDPLAAIHQLCGDARDIIATSSGKGRVRLNGEAEVSLDEFILRLRAILAYRAEKLVFVTGDSQASWGDFIAMVDRIWPEADVVSIITPKVERLALQQHCLAPSCGRCENFRSLRAR
jgi:hypothetical protein